MKKNHISLAVACAMFFVVHSFINAQGVAVNETGTPADASAVLDISSSTKGVLVPRLTGVQRIMIAAPAEGLLVYDTDSDSFWFYSAGWHEIAAGGGTPSGPAGGDLSGDYPTPNVVKLQNLDVAFGVPLDKQVLKWDVLSNNWKGRNDSLFLPYNVAFGSPTKLFGIQNNNTSNGSSAIYGRSGTTGSGITPGLTKGVWGDNSSAGAGVLGTSYEGTGVLGSSIYQHGVTGYSGNSGFAGIYGTHTEYNGVGVLGEIEENSIALMGKTTGSQGKAAIFCSTAPSHGDTTLTVSTSGIGLVASFMASNTIHNKPVIDILQAGNGNGLKVRVTKTSNISNGVDIVHSGAGNALYSKSENGIPAKFEISNASSAYPVLHLNNIGMGNTMTVVSTQSANGNNVIDIQTLGLGNAINVATSKARCAYLTQNDINATNDAFHVNTLGKGGVAKFTKNNTSGLPEDPHNPAVQIDNTSKGVGLKINSLHSPSINHGVEIQYQGQASGLHVNSNKKGIYAVSSSSVDPAIDAKNTSIGMAIKAVSSNFAGLEGTVVVENNGGGTGLRVDVTGGTTATGIRSFTDSTYGSGVHGYTSGTAGGVRGTSLEGGIGVMGEGGTVGAFGLLSRAGTFTNYNVENTLPALTATHMGNGVPLLIKSEYNYSYQPSLKIENSGYGNFVAFDNDGIEKFFIEKDGDVFTDGTITVKENKGIVRNTYSSQLRVETVEAVIDIPGNGTYELFVPNEVMDIAVTFNTAFSSPPTVCVGNYLGGVNGDNLNTVITNVTNSGCTLHIQNLTASNISVGDHSWKILVMGVE